jgi:hypothetical protein
VCVFKSGDPTLIGSTGVLVRVAMCLMRIYLRALAQVEALDDHYVTLRNEKDNTMHTNVPAREVGMYMPKHQDKVIVLQGTHIDTHTQAVRLPRCATLSWKKYSSALADAKHIKRARGHRV